MAVLKYPSKYHIIRIVPPIEGKVNYVVWVVVKELVQLHLQYGYLSCLESRGYAAAHVR